MQLEEVPPRSESQITVHFEEATAAPQAGPNSGDPTLETHPSSLVGLTYILSFIDIYLPRVHLEIHVVILSVMICAENVQKY